MADFFDEFKRVEEEINKIRRRLDELWRSPLSESFGKLAGREFREPLTQTHETPNELILRFELPGVEKKDITLEITPTTIKVKAQKKQQHEIVRKSFYKSERITVGFYRAITLPARVDAESVDTKYENGVLEVKLKKAEARKEKVKRVRVR